MRWLSWFRRHHQAASEDAPLDLERFVAAAIQDPGSHRQAVARLRRERRALVRRQRAVAKQFERLPATTVTTCAKYLTMTLSWRDWCQQKPHWC